MLLLLMSTSPTQTKDAPLLLVANQTDQSLSIIDANRARELDRVKTREVRGHEVVASPDGRFAYVPIYGDSGVGLPGTSGHTIEIIDLTTHKVTDTIDLGHPVRPHCVKFGPDGLLYVSAELDNAIDIVDPHTRKRVGSIATERPQSHMFVISSDGKRAYTSNVDSGTVTVLDLTTRKPVIVIPVADRAQRISISNDDRFVFTADQTQPRLAVIDTHENKVARWIPLPSIGYGTAPTRDGKWLLVTLTSVNKLAIVDLEKMTVINTIPVGNGPVEILTRPDKPIAYISCTKDGAVAVLDLKTWNLLDPIAAAPGADGLAWASPK
jgi:YVTN family beta-propeller protein